MESHELNETEVRTQLITPALMSAGWDFGRDVREEFQIAAGRIDVRGELATRRKPSRADYVLFLKPNIPLGLNKRNKNNITKAIASLYPEGRNQIPKFSANPNKNEPNTAPGTDPIPPITAPVNPLIIKVVPIIGSRFCSKPTKIPATPAIADPIIKLHV